MISRIHQLPKLPAVCFHSIRIQSLSIVPAKFPDFPTWIFYLETRPESALSLSKTPCEQWRQKKRSNQPAVKKYATQKTRESVRMSCRVVLPGGWPLLHLCLNLPSSYSSLPSYSALALCVNLKSYRKSLRLLNLMLSCHRCVGCAAALGCLRKMPLA